MYVITKCFYFVLAFFQNVVPYPYYKNKNINNWWGKRISEIVYSNNEKEKGNMDTITINHWHKPLAFTSLYGVRY